jgi:hypothetical protein
MSRDCAVLLVCVIATHVRVVLMVMIYRFCIPGGPGRGNRCERRRRKVWQAEGRGTNIVVSGLGGRRAVLVI